MLKLIAVNSIADYQGMALLFQGLLAGIAFICYLVVISPVHNSSKKKLGGK